MTSKLWKAAGQWPWRRCGGMRRPHQFWRIGERSAPACSVWTDWYQARLDGRPAYGPLEIDRVLIAPELWEAGPRAVNAEIRRLIDIHAPAAGQGPGTHVFSVDGGVIAAAPVRGGASIDAEVVAGMAAGLLRAARRLLSRLSGNLADPDLAQTVSDLIVDIDAPVASLRIGLLLVDLRMLRQAAATYGDSNLELERAATSQVGGLADALEDFVSVFAAIHEIEAMRISLGVIGVADFGGLRQTMAAIVSTARQSRHVARSVPEALTEGDRQIATLSQVIDDGRTTAIERAAALKTRGEQVGQQLVTHRGFVSQTVSAAAAAGRAIGSDLTDGARAGVKKSAELVVIGSFGYLCASLVPHVDILAAIQPSLQPIATALTQWLKSAPKPP
jgi:hypothetical protein